MGKRLITNKNIILKNGERIIDVEIEKPVSEKGGSMCMAYYVTYSEKDGLKHRAVLKEYCPKYLEDLSDPIRDENNNLVIPVNYKEQFESGIKEFIDVYSRINNYLLENFAAANSHPTLLGLFYGNNTVYTLTSADYGINYNDTVPAKLIDELKITLAVTKAVEMYHSAGYLHLDIKPQNIFILNEVNDLVKLFDYDSLTDIEQIKKGIHVSDTGVYYVPEIRTHNFKRIGISTDIFIIASMLYHRVFGNAPSREQMSSDYKYDFDMLPLLKGISPKALFELETLFKNTLQISVSRRYKTTEEFKHQLEKIISLVDSNSPYLLNLPKWQPSSYCLGREQELKYIHQELQDNGYIMIKAMGGLGKSELAKMYASQYGDSYHTVQFCKYTGSLKALVSAISIKGIKDSEYENLDKLARAKNDILHDCDSHTLIVIDNFNVTYDEYLREFLPVDNNGFKVIFTTRCEPAQDYLHDKVYELTTLPNDICKHLFYLHSNLTVSENNDKQIEKLLEIIKYNTLVLVLLAKSMKITKVNLESVLYQLEQSKIDDVSGVVFHEYDYSSIEGDNYNRVFAHLNTIFNISNLTTVQKEILLCLSLVSNLGMEIDEFIKDCENEFYNENEITELIAYGWIEQESEIISLHPIVSDLIFANKNIPRNKSYDNLSYSIIDQCNSLGVEHIDVMNAMFSYLYHLNKRIGNEIEFRSIDVKLYLAKLCFNLYMPKEATQRLNEAEKIISNSFRYKPRLCGLYWLRGEIENEFGNPERGIKLYQTAISYCKKTVNCYYDERINSIIGIAECYAKLHKFKEAYKYYLDAYNYIYTDSFKEKLNSKIFVTNDYGKKDLVSYVPDICDGIIEVCTELQLPQEVAKFKKIKNQFKTEDNPFNMALELIKNGDFKEGTRSFFQELDRIKQEFGDESPLYRELINYAMPLLIFSNKESGEMSLNPITEGINYYKEKYGLYSVRYLEYLLEVTVLISNLGEIAFAEQLIEQSQNIVEKLGLIDTIYYQQITLRKIVILLNKGSFSELKEVVMKLNVQSFQTKSDLEELVLYGGAFYLIGLNEQIGAIALRVFNMPNVSNFAYFRASILLAQISIDNDRLDEANNYLKCSAQSFDKMTDGFVKQEYSYDYYSVLARYYSNLFDNKKAFEAINNYILLNNKENICYSNINILCKAMAERTIYLRFLEEYDKAYNSIVEAMNLLKKFNSNKTSFKSVYGNYAIMCVYKDKIDEAVAYMNKTEALFTQDEKVFNRDWLSFLVYFIQALCVKRYPEYYDLLCNYCDQAVKIVETGHFEQTIFNAMLHNFIGIILADYEEEFGLAENHFNNAKNILEENNCQETALYKQIISNIEYASNKVMDSLIAKIAAAYDEDNNDEEE